MAGEGAAASLGLQIGTTIGGLYAQHEALKQRRREIDRSLNSIQESIIRNNDALDRKQVIVAEEVKRAKFEVAAKTVAIEGQARVKAAQLGLSAGATEEVILDIQREKGQTLSDITESAGNAYADIRTDLDAANQSLQDQIWGINTTVPSVAYAAGVAQIGTAAAEYATYVEKNPDSNLFNFDS